MRLAHVPHRPGSAPPANTAISQSKVSSRGCRPRSGLLPTPRHYEVLGAVADQRIRRDVLLGRLEPHLLNGRDVIWTLRGLVLRGLVQLQPIGPPRLTTRGRQTLDSST